MNLSRWTRIAEWAVVAAVIALQAPMLLPDRGEIPGFVVYSGMQTLKLSQPAILLAWAIVGPGRWWWRVPVAASLFCAVGVWWGALPSDRSWSNDDSMFLAFCATIFTLLGLLRLGGLSVRGREASQEPRAQFSIRMLLVATTLVAGVIGVLEYLRPALATFEFQEVVTFGFPGGKVMLPIESFTANSLRAIVLGTSSAAIAAGAILVMLRPGAIWLRAIILVITVPALAGYLIHLINVSDSTLSQRVGELAWAFAALAGTTAVSVLPLKLFGFRLFKPSAKPADSVAAPSRSLAAQQSAVQQKHALSESAS